MFGDPDYWQTFLGLAESSFVAYRSIAIDIISRRKVSGSVEDETGEKVEVSEEKAQEIADEIRRLYDYIQYDLVTAEDEILQEIDGLMKQLYIADGEVKEHYEASDITSIRIKVTRELKRRYPDANTSVDDISDTKVETEDETKKDTENKKTISGMVIMGNANNSYGDSTDPIQNPNAYKPTGDTIGDDADKLTEIGGIIIAILRIVGVVVAVITLIILGFKYMSGGVSEKAEYRKSMVPFLIGAGILLIGTQLVAILYDVASNNNTGSVKKNNVGGNRIDSGFVTRF